MVDSVLVVSALLLGALLLIGYLSYQGDMLTGHVLHEFVEPVCGNGIIDPNETFENCCLDVDCPPSFSCMNISYGGVFFMTCGRNSSALFPS